MSRRFLVITVTFAMLLAFSGLAIAQQNTNPAITTFSSSLKSVDRRALTNRTARIPVSWTTINRPIFTNLVFEQVLPDNTFINVELPRLVPWVNSDGNGTAAPILPDGNATAIRLRVRLVNVLTQETLDSEDLTLPISLDGSGATTGPTKVPTITSFSTPFKGKINRNELVTGTARIPVVWTAINRPVTATLVFEQVMTDGTLVNVELPRSTPWVNSSDKGVVAPRLPGGTTIEVRIRLRLVDLVYSRVLDQRDIILPVDTGIVQPPTIISFATSRSSVTLNELRNRVQIPVTWEVANRPPNTNLLFEQVMANNQTRNAELPRDFVIVPSIGQGTVVLIDSGSTSEVLFHVRLVDLTDGSTLSTREMRLPILNTGTNYRIVTGDACYSLPFPASNNVTIGQLGRVLYFNSGATLALYKDKAPSIETLTFLKPNDTFNIVEGPYCVINDDQVPVWNFRQWKVKTLAGNLSGWLYEYHGNPEQGFVKYITANVSQVDTKPEIVTFNVQPSDKLDFNGTVTVTWEVRNAVRILLMLGQTTLVDQGTTGSLTLNVKDIYGSNPIRFALSAYDTQQNATDTSINIPVQTAGTSIKSFTVTPVSVQQGAPVSVTWEIEGPFTSAHITYDKIDSEMGMPEINVTTNSGQGTITVDANVTNRIHTFSLWVVDVNGVTVTKDVPVTVTCSNTAFFVSDPTNQNGRCASAQSSIQAAYQPFAGGFMLWKKNPDGLTNILVFYNSGTYTYFADWDGTPYQILDATPNVLLPIRGFGYIWNANPNVKNILGYPTTAEQGYTATYQFTVTYGKYGTGFYYVTLPNGRTVRYASGVNSGSAWGFVN